VHSIKTTTYAGCPIFTALLAAKVGIRATREPPSLPSPPDQNQTTNIYNPGESATPSSKPSMDKGMSAGYDKLEELSPSMT
jgi:hypothetical protein